MTAAGRAPKRPAPRASFARVVSRCARRTSPARPEPVRWSASSSCTATHAIAPVTEALLMAADRAQHVAEVVVPALERGEWVVSDRYLPSSLVYQGVVRGLGVDAVRTMNGAAIAGASPDLVVVLTVPEEQARARRRTTPDRLEAEGGDFHDAVAQAYLKLAATEGWAVVDGTGDVDTVAARVRSVLEPLLAG